MKIRSVSAIVSLLVLIPAQGCRGGSAGGHEDHAGHAAAGSAPCSPQLEELPPSGEGMWPWEDLAEMDERELRARGLDLRLEDVWTPGEGGLAGATVGLEGCTASFVSSDGLMITNHHCAYGAIQRNSTDARNLLEEGFLASSREEELDGQGTKAFVFRGHTDVTAEVAGGLVDGLSDLERMRYIEKREKELVKQCEEKPNTRCRVSRVNDGLQFVLLEYLEIRDVRLVAAPPSRLGNFGGEVDNWHWPRHTMDFSLLRAWVGEDGEPAEYDPGNVPYHPEHWFPITGEGIREGDLAMVLGTPYHTARYRTARSVEHDRDWYYPLRVDVFSEWISLLDATCAEIPDSCLPTAGMNRSLNNGLTNAEGMIAGLERARVVERKLDEQEKWKEWVQEDPARKELWAGSLEELESYLEDSQEGRDRDFLVRYILLGSNLLGAARTLTKWAAEQEKKDELRDPGYQERDREDVLSDLRNVQKSIHAEADRRVLAMFIQRLGELPEDQRLRAIDEALMGDYSPEAVNLFLDQLYAGTLLADQAERERLFGQSLAELGTSEDTMIQLALALQPELDAWEDRKKAHEGALSRLRPPYLESLVAMRGETYYPDANATPRISFATVAGYEPRDGIWHVPFTTLSGIAEKQTGEAPFDAPAAVLDAIAAGDHGPYVDPRLGDVPVCFLSNADTTGGNSGSPVLDGEGHLVGINFDRVYENIAGDYGYDPALSRNIMVDVRAILWYLDRVLGAQHLLDELDLVEPETAHH